MRGMGRSGIRFLNNDAPAGRGDMPAEAECAAGLGVVLSECLCVLAVMLGVYGILLALESVLPEFELYHSAALFGIAVIAIASCFLPYVLLRKKRFRLICIGVTALLWLLIWTVFFFKPVAGGMKLLLSSIEELLEAYYGKRFFFVALEECEGWSGQMMCTAFAVVVSAPLLWLFGFCMFWKRGAGGVFAVHIGVIVGCLMLGYCPSLASVYLMAIHVVIAAAVKSLQGNDRHRGMVFACVSLAAAMFFSTVVIKPVFYNYVDLNGIQQKAYRLLHSGDGIELLKDIAYDMTGIFRSTSYGGISGGVLGQTSRLEYRNQVDLIVTAEDDIDNPVYLKAFVGGEYTGRGWTNSDVKFPDTLEEYSVLDASYQFLKELNNEWTVQNDFASLTIEVVKGDGGYVYFPYLSHVIDTDGSAVGDLYLERDGQTSDVFAYINVNTEHALRQYRYLQRLREYSGLDTYNISNYLYGRYSKEQLYLNYVNYWYLSVPEDCCETLREAAQEAQAEFLEYEWNDTVENKVTFVKEYLAEQAEYSLEPGKTPKNRDFVDYFLTEQQEGYCTHFASAGVLLFRLLGVPARYVEGYRLPDGLKAGEATEVLDTCAHAWVEIYLEGYGWIPVDVTPGYSDSEITSSADEDEEGSEYMEQTTQTVTPAETESSEPEPEQEQTLPEEGQSAAVSDVETENGSEAASIVKDVTETEGAHSAGNTAVALPGNESGGTGNDGEDSAVGAAVHFRPEEWLPYALPILLALLAVAVLLIVVQLRRVSLLRARRRRITSVNRNKAVVAIYTEQIYMIARSGVGPAVTRDCKNACQRCDIYDGLCGVAKEEWQGLLSLVKEAKFSNHVISEEQFRRALALYRRFAAELPKEMKRGQRLLFRYFWGY